MNQKYFSYFTFGLTRIIDRTLLNKREEIFNVFAKVFNPQSYDKILDIGVSSEEHLSSNLFEKKYIYTEQITAVGIGDFQDLEIIYPGLKFVKADGRYLPFPDQSFDYVYSHAVIEHTGSRDLQLKFLCEAFRVASKGIFITTPNRLHPLEFHTALPLIHYLPPNWYRRIYRILGKTFYSQESNLNLLTEKDIMNLVNHLPVEKSQVNIYFTKFLFFKANLLLVIHKGVKSSDSK